MLEKLQNMLSEQLGISPSLVTLDASFKDDLSLDSLDLYEMVMAVEDEYNVQFPIEELAKVNTVGEVIDFFRENGIEL